MVKPIINDSMNQPFEGCFIYIIPNREKHPKINLVLGDDHPMWMKASKGWVSESL
jgi:hypothetical protein